jgi:hypothetical protein
MKYKLVYRTTLKTRSGKTLLVPIPPRNQTSLPTDPPTREEPTRAELADLRAALEEANEAAKRVIQAADENEHVLNGCLSELREAREVVASSNRYAAARASDDDFTLSNILTAV